MGLIVLTVVVAGCGPDTTQTDRDGGVAAAPTTTTDDAPSGDVARTELPPSTPPSVLAETLTPPSSAAPSVPPTPAAATATTNPPSPPPQSEGESLPLPLPLPAPLDPAVLVPDQVSINTARVVVNQSNVAVNTGGVSGSSASARSVVESEAAVLVVQQSPSGLQVVSLDVRPGWVEAARSDTPERLTLRYVLGSAAVDISVWANGGGISSSVSSSFDR